MADDAPRTLVDLTKARRFDVRQLLKMIGLVSLVLFVTSGPGIREAGEEMEPGLVRTLVLAVGEPAGALGDVIPLHEVADEATAWLSSDDDLGEGSGFSAVAAEPGATGGVPPVTPDALDPAAVGEPVEPLPLRKLLVTGDSLAMPLDAELARRLAERDVETKREPHIGTGVSKDSLVDWGKLSAKQTKDESPDAVVMFIGANEGFSLPGPEGKEVECCGRDWTALYATRVRQMMDTYRRAGAARVYWLTLPAPRDPDRQEIARSVNAGIEAAVAPFGAHVRVLDMAAIFTPGFRYRAAMAIDGRETIVRESDGIHLNEDGARLAADAVMAAIDRDFAK
ncbi:MAG TPA: GDSL-type esterase/lipase family protein [Solirubrobacteraceae bacterium]|nr:GDSL-type esterase/lipase family protein [Solirubrobacteraceae bacterium]